MHFSFIRRRKLSALSKALLFASVVFYFSYHMVSGDKGLMAMVQLQQRVNSSYAELGSLDMDKIKLQHRVKMMYSGSLDKDLIDEQSRRLLGYAGENEVVLLGY